MGWLSVSVLILVCFACRSWMSAEVADALADKIEELRRQHARDTGRIIDVLSETRSYLWQRIDAEANDRFADEMNFRKALGTFLANYDESEETEE